MAHRIRNLGVIFALLLALLARPSATQAASFTLAPAQPAVVAGQAITFIGTGFTRDERVVTWATAPDQSVIGGAYADAVGLEGRIEVSLTVPANAIGGRWAMTAYGLRSKTPVVTSFEVNGRAADTSPQAAVAPFSGPPGTQFAFAAFGYKSKEDVSYWFTGSDGVVHDAYPHGATTTSDGRVDITWKAPSDAVRGTWVITIQGLKSDVARAVPFEIR